FPHRNRATPITVSRNRPIASILNPFTKLAVLDVLGNPVNVFIQLNHAVTNLSDPDEPARNGLINQRVAATPTMRITVLVAFGLNQLSALTEQLDEWLIGIKDLQTGNIVH